MLEGLCSKIDDEVQVVAQMKKEDQQLHGLVIGLSRRKIICDWAPGGYGFSLHPYPDDNDDAVVGRIVDLSKDLGLVTMQQTKTINMFSCINGIICIGGSFRAPGGCFHSFVLWNPAIRERKIISYPWLPGPPSHLVKPYNSKAFYAFGYDQYSNDYKVVRIVTYNKDSPPTQKSLFTDYYNIFQVFSLKAYSWAPVIDTTLHRSNISLLSPCYEVYFNGGYGFSLHPYPDDNDDAVVGRIVDLSKDLGLVTMQQTKTINMFSCINGIICIGGSFRAPGGCFHSFILWNPAIRERKIISYPWLPGPPSHLVKPYNSKAFYAFGYDQYSNDYKVVRIVTYNKDSPPTQKSLFTDYYNIFQVFSLKAYSWAPVIDTTLHRSNISLLSPCYEVYFNGAHHWLGFFDNGHNKPTRGEM
nr:f-box/kelch-repeat protein [Quercus suber]